MNDIQISNFFTSLGIRPNHKGYSYLIYLVKICSCWSGPFPCMKDLYQQTAEHFGVTGSKVEHNIRTVVRCYWAQKDSQKIFTKVTHYPITTELTPKEFISVLSEFVSSHNQTIC